MHVHLIYKYVPASTVYMLECTWITTTLHFQSGLISLATPVSLSSTLVQLLQSSILSYSSLLT